MEWTLEPQPTEAGSELSLKPNQVDCLLKPSVTTLFIGFKQFPRSEKIASKLFRIHLNYPGYNSKLSGI